jgi:hypothetical protein
MKGKSMLTALLSVSAALGQAGYVICMGTG